jgi:hypothetical protein
LDKPQHAAALNDYVVLRSKPEGHRRPNRRFFCVAWERCRLNRVRHHVGERDRIMDIKSFAIGALLVGCLALGYFAYQSQQSSVKIDVPGVKIEGN